MAGIRHLIFAIFIILSISQISCAYMPPVYIANPETGACQSYFAGDSKHYNPLPEGNWEIVGMNEQNASYCQYSCFFNSNKFWQAVMEITQNNMSIDELPLEYRIFTNLTCMCIGDGQESCKKWCDIKNGVLKNSSSGKYNCVCGDGKWDYGGCSYVSPMGNAIDFSFDYDIIINLAILFAGIALGYMISKKIKARMKIQSRTGNKK